MRCAKCWKIHRATAALLRRVQVWAIASLPRLHEVGEPSGAHTIANVRDESGDAYQDCLKGRYFLNKVTGESLQRAIGCFQSALSQDAHYAPAWAGLADAYARLALIGHW